MININHSNSGNVIKGFGSDLNPKFISTDKIEKVISSASTTPSINGDKHVDVHVDASTVSEYDVVVNHGATYSVSDESVATVNSDGLLNYVSDGAVTLTVNCGKYGKIAKNFSFIASGGNITETFSSWVAGSLAEELSNNVDTAIDGLTAGDAKPIFSVQDHGLKIYTRNTGCWANGWDLSSISPYNSSGVHTKAGTAITPRHVLIAAHYRIPNGSKIRFVGMDNVVHERTVLANKNHPDYSPYYPDLNLLVLDSDLPASITPAKLAPSNLGDYLSNVGDGHPALTLDKEEKALIHDLRYLFTYGRHSIQYKYPVDPTRNSFTEEIIGGDSGNPSFLIVDGELVLLTVWTSGYGSESGTFVGAFIDDINQLIVDVDTTAGDLTGYTVTVKDLSTYPTY